MALGGLWLCLWRQPWRLWGVAGIVVGVAAVAFVTPPNVIVNAKGGLLAVRAADGSLAVSSLRKARFERKIWRRLSGSDEPVSKWPKEGYSADGRLSCDLLGCIYRAGGQTVALVQRGEALEEDCRSADVIVSIVPVRNRCPSAHTVVDRFDLWRNGAHALWLTDGKARVESVNASRGHRPWVVRPKSKKSVVNNIR